jgi:hypothetical protein
MFYTSIQYQQAILSALGFYKGRCDGFWGPDSVAAKRDWEKLDSFEPGVMSNGAPFTPGCRLPKGFSWSAGKIISVTFSTSQLNEIINKSGGFLTVKEVENHVFPSASTAPASKAVEAKKDDFVEQVSDTKSVQQDKKK